MQFIYRSGGGDRRRTEEKKKHTRKKDIMRIYEEGELNTGMIGENLQAMYKLGLPKNRNFTRN